MSKREGIKGALATKVYKRDGYACRHCGRPKRAGVVHIHHVVAVSDGGSDDADNLITLCVACHREWHTVEMAATVPFNVWLDHPPARLWMYLPPERWPDGVSAKDMRDLMGRIQQEMKGSPDFFWPALEKAAEG